MKGIQNLRVDYSGEIVDLKNFDSDPINEFKSWFEFAKNNEVIEPNAMVLSTLNNNSINLSPKPSILKAFLETKCFIAPG